MKDRVYVHIFLNKVNLKASLNHYLIRNPNNFVFKESESMKNIINIIIMIITLNNTESIITCI